MPSESQKIFTNWWKNIGKQLADETTKENICNICRKVFTKGYKGEEYKINEKEDLVIKEAYKIGIKTHLINLSRKIDGVFINFT